MGKESTILTEVEERTATMRGVTVRWTGVILAGHTIEQVLSYDVAEAEAFHGRPFDAAMFEHIQLGMFTADRIAADEMMSKDAAAFGDRRG